MALFPKIPTSPMFRGAVPASSGSTAGRVTSAVGKSTGIGTLAGIASLFAFLEPANRLLNQGANLTAANALPSIQELIRLAWTNPDNKTYWKTLARTWGYDSDIFDELLRASIRWPTVDEVTQAFLLGIFGNLDEYNFTDKEGNRRILTYEDFLTSAQVPKELQPFYRLLTVRPFPLETSVRLFRRYGNYSGVNPENGNPIVFDIPQSGDYKKLYDASKKAEGLETKPDEDIFKAFQVHPGVADLIRFAVREVFTPEIAAKFGQYEDLPQVFIQEAKKAGLNSVDASRFWAAHWELPSITQGFEMLHRGVIDQSTLELLLRAQDVMPFWREKLIKISYRVPRLVDIYRLYEQRVIPRIDPDNVTLETPLVKRFMSRGYTFEDAKDLSIWLDRTRPDPATEATIKSVVSSFEEGLIDESDFLSLLSDLNLAKPTEDFLIQSSKVNRNKNLLEISIKRLSPLLRDGSISEAEFRRELQKYGLTDAAIGRMIDKIESEQADKSKGLTESQVLRLYGKGLIDTDKEALALIIASGRTKNAASLLLKEAKRDRETGVDSVPFADMKGFLSAGTVDEGRFRDYCKAKGMPDWAISAYVSNSPVAETLPETNV